jgi:hypothetical protein
MPRPHWRPMTWVIFVWCALIVVWAIAGGSSASNQCAQSAYQNACNAGAGIGVALILFIGFIGFVFLSLIWFMTGRGRRDCPACGRGVKRGKTVCPACGHDFAASARAGA